MSKKHNQPEVQKTPEPIRYDQQPKQSPADMFITELTARLNWYYDAMRPGKVIDPNEGVHAQRTLWTIVRDVFNVEGVEFYKAMSALMEQIQRHRQDVFHEQYIFRFFDVHGAMTGTDRLCFERVMTVLMNTCNPLTRQLSMRQIDMNEAMKHCPPEWQGKLESFFSL